MDNIKRIEKARDDFNHISPRIGDLVKLASGSPLMTIVDISGNFKNVTVSYRGENGITETEFPRICLRRIVV